MQDFLTFKTFISPSILTMMYLFGLFLMPFFLWYLFKRISPYFPKTVLQLSEQTWQNLSLGQKSKLLLLLFMMLLCMEICWRMMFEFLIAYMQIREALVGV